MLVIFSSVLTHPCEHNQPSRILIVYDAVVCFRVRPDNTEISLGTANSGMLQQEHLRLDGA